MNDKDATSRKRMVAGVRFSENTDELARLDPQIQEREQELPLRERVKNIFKKYGWTLQAVALAVGIVLSALALAATSGLKAGTKAIGNGLETIGKKLGSLLPGLIGSIVSYIFKAAGSVLSFLGEHAWLLILAVVAFFMKGCSRGDEDKHILYTMAEGGYDPDTENKTPWEDHGIDHDDDDDEEFKSAQSTPMKPPPAPPEENFEMRYLPRERQNKWELSASQKDAWFDVKNMYPAASKAALEVDYVKTPGVKDPRLSIKIRGAMRSYWLFENRAFYAGGGKIQIFLKISKSILESQSTTK